MDNNTKKCGACKVEKPLSEFYFRKETGKYRAACKKCKSINTKEQIRARLISKTKVCKHCCIEKSVSEYQKAGGGKWLQPYCKPCDAIRKRKYEEINKDHVVKSRKLYYQNNKDIIIERTKEYRDKNIEKIKKRTQEYRDKNRDLINKRGREYIRKNSEILNKKHMERYYANHEKYLLKAKIARANRTPEQIEKKKKYDREYKIKNKGKLAKWRKENADKVREQKRIWGNKKAATDITYRIKRNLRTRIRCALKPNNAYKVDTSENLLGCTIDFFKQYFESLFTEGMSWDKFMSADIEIDHIKPCAKFDLTKEDEQRKCFHYTNCQPMWWYDNNQKGAKYQEPNIS